MLFGTYDSLSHSPGQLYGLEKFWAFLKYSRRKVDVNEELQAKLSQFKKLSDFRVVVSYP